MTETQGDEAPKARATSLDDIETGNLDKRGRKVREVYWTHPEFRIYRTDYGTSPMFSDTRSTADEQALAFVRLGPGIARFNHRAMLLRGIGSPDDKDAAEHFEREYARCVAQALLGQEAEAAEALAALQGRVERRLQNRAGARQFTIAMVLAVGAVLVCAGLLRLDPAPTPGDVTAAGLPVDVLLLAIMMGVVGALFSTAARLPWTEVDPSVPRLSQWIFGFQRLVAGALGAVVLYFAVASGVLDGLLAPGAEDTSTIDSDRLAFLFLLAGFSERMVPNLLDARAGRAAPAP
ncbi:hypothetical protein HKCCE2091_04920 [Rhodobacterales bacterium HKCCE2091]|nr:hypothetical protein [Rhodobacterales bacterium HKCCE2091]